MNWLLFFLLVALHPVAFVLIARADMTRTKRVLLLIALFVPGTLYCWDYFAIQYEHEELCEAEAGLKVLIQPEKVDRVRLMGDRFRKESAPKAIFEKYYPQVTAVEALQTKEVGRDGRPLPYYVIYTAAPNPKAGQWEKGSRQEGKLIFATARVDALDPAVYEISEQEVQISHGIKTEMTLSKGGKVYAKHTTFVHWWTGIQYPDAVPTWRCPDTNKKSPPKDEPNAPYREWTYPPFAFDVLRELIFK